MLRKQDGHTFRFLDFQYKAAELELLYKNQKIKLSKKNHEVLLALIKANGKVMSKDELIAEVWPNQIVTDAALNKQVTRLRQALPEEISETIIETIRGVGFKFAPEIIINSARQIQHHRTQKLLIVIISMFVLLLLYLIFEVTKKNDKQPDVNALLKQETTNLAVIRNLSNDSWLNLGGIGYLSKRLLSYDKIQTVEPEKNWFKQENQDLLGIEVSQNTGIHYVLQIDHKNIGQNYYADLLLRDNNAVLAKQTLEASSVQALINKVEFWIIEQLNIFGELKIEQKDNSQNVSDFVMESYLRGLAARQSRSFDEANQLFNTAVSQDSDFYPAWFALIDVETEMGHFDQSLAMIKTLLESGKLSEKLIDKLLPIQVKVLIYLNQLEEAQVILDRSMHKSMHNQDVNAIMYNMNNQLLLNDYKGVVDVGEISLAKKLLALTEKFDPSPNQVGTRQHNLAIILNEHLQHKQAINAIESAIENFKKANNAEGLLASYRIWAEIHAHLAQFGEAQMLMEKGQVYLSEVEGVRAVAHYWMAYGWIHYELGDLTGFQKSIAALNQMSVDYSNLQPRVKALVLEADMAISYGQFHNARVVVDALLEIIVQNPDDYPLDAPYTVALDLYLLARSDQSNDAKIKKDHYLSLYPSLADSIKNELNRIDAHILASEGFTYQAIKKLAAVEQVYLANRDVLYANYVAYEIIDLMDINKDTVMFKSVLDRLESRDHFVYPFKKFKARWLAQQGKLMHAIGLMSELKVQAKDFWNSSDQLMLENWQMQYKIKGK